MGHSPPSRDTKCLISLFLIIQLKLMWQICFSSLSSTWRCEVLSAVMSCDVYSTETRAVRSSTNYMPTCRCSKAFSTVVVTRITASTSKRVYDVHTFLDLRSQNLCQMKELFKVVKQYSLAILVSSFYLTLIYMNSRAEQVEDNGLLHFFLCGFLKLKTATCCGKKVHYESNENEPKQ